ncbi:hypothetical protein SD427_18225 [Chryseobacterium sp. JJR-5R]|uniref:hypothetical protein n=1 Tax=Chryseobacterium sp. JJR-5R TaxID=3093923 RepID=UPI002A764544|nr:hypothetical protein [Chryseobacterium sp. JJR-5R]WPO82675.1 hypothetical protein SD427_18225 [Chryseobacterium sp. JJR-5R]
MKKLILTAAFTLLGLGAASAQTTTPQSTNNQTAAQTNQKIQADSSSGVTTAKEIPEREVTAVSVADNSKITTAVDDAAVTASADKNTYAAKSKNITSKNRSKSKKSK